jgi:methionine-rich copper-binding protein CopC
VSSPGLSRLEQRILLSGEPSTFAVVAVQQTQSQEPGITDIQISIPDFTLPQGHATIGLLLQGDAGAPPPRLLRIVPQGQGSAQIISSTQHAFGEAENETLVRLTEGSFSLVVRSGNGVPGLYQVSAFLAGDVNGDFQVSTADLGLIRSLLGVRSSNPRYQAGADLDGNGVIGPRDLRLARQNVGVATQVRPLFATLGLDPATGLDAQGQVTAAAVTVRGQTEPGATVRLAQGTGNPFTQETTADAAGRYRFNIAALPGLNSLLVEATDGFGQSSTASLMVIRAGGSPVPGGTQTVPLSIQSLSSGSVTNQNVTVTGIVPNALSAARLEAQVDSGPLVSVPFAASGSFRFTTALALDGSADGTHTVVFEAIDPSGNVVGQASTSFILDTVAPQVTLASPTANQISPTNVTVMGQVVDATSGVDALQAQVDNGPMTPVSFNAAGQFQFVTALPLDGSADGLHTVQIVAVDRAGNASTPARVAFTLDSQAPVVVIQSPAASVMTRTNLTLTGQVEDATSGVAALEAQIDNGPFTPVSFDATGEFHLVTALPLDGSADGLNTVSFRATDQAGNVSGLVSQTFTLDTRPPQVMIQSPAPDVATNANLTVTGRVTDVISGVASLHAQVDNGPAVPVTFDTTGQFQFVTALPLDGSADGSHTIHIVAQDRDGNSSAPVDIAFTLDTRPPAIQLETPASGTLTATAPTLAGVVTDLGTGVASLQAQVDSGPPRPVTFDPTTGSFLFPTGLAADGTADGTHTVALRALDRAGNASDPTEVTFVLDSTPPTITLASPIATLTDSASLTISGQVADKLSGVGSMTGQVDGGAVVPVNFDSTGAFQFPVTLPIGGTADGPHAVHFQAFDKAGNASAITTVSFSLDSTAPTLTITTRNGLAADANVTIVGTVADGLSGVATLQAQVDSGPLVPVDFNAAGGYQLTTDLPLNGSADGPHVVRLVATDVAGNSTAPAQVSFTLDTQPPVVVLSGPAPGETTNQNITVVGQVTDSLSGVASLQASIDSGPFYPVSFDSSGQFQYRTTLALDGTADGTHTVHVQAVDKAGNRSGLVDESFTLDTQPPVVSIASPVSDLETSGNVVVQGHVADALSGVTSLQAQVDSGPLLPVPFDPSGNFQFTTDLPLDGSADGPHTVRVLATDKVGNNATPAGVSFTLDTQPPVIVVTAPPSGDVTNHNITVVGQVTDALLGVALLQASVDSGPLLSVPYDGAGNFSFTTRLFLDGAADGVHTVHLVATDATGNVSSPTDITFTLDTTDPTITLTSAAPGIVTNSNPTISGVVADTLSGVATLTASIDAGTPVAVSVDAAGGFSVTTALALNGSADGTHTVRLVATDNAGNVSGTFTSAFTPSAPIWPVPASPGNVSSAFTFTLDTQPPVINVQNPAANAFTSSAIVTGRVTDALSGVTSLEAKVDGGVFTPVALDAQDDFQFNTGLVSGGSSDGPHTVSLEATDTAGNTSNVFTLPFTLDTQPPAIVVQSPAANAPTTSVTVTGVVTDALSGVARLQAEVDGGPFTTVLVGSQGQFTFATGLATGGAADGPHTVDLQAVDTAGNVSSVVSLPFILKTRPPSGPTFDLAPGTADLGPEDTSAAQVTLVGQTDPGVTLALVGSGLTTMASTTGTFQIPGVSLAAGTNTLTVQATDALGNTSSNTLTVTRSPAPANAPPNAVIVWNEATLNAIQTDGTDPLMSSRALAMVQAAVFDSVNSVEGAPAYYVKVPAPADASVAAAVDAAAHDVLGSLYPAQQATFDALLASELALLPGGQGTTDGEDVGQAVGNAIIAMRAKDGSKAYVDFTPGTAPGDWQPTAPAYAPALDPQGANMTPWALTSANQFDPAGPPALTSQQWADAVNQVESLGAVDSTTRTAAETTLAQFWNDGVGTDTPSGHWNAIAQTVAQQEGDSLSDDARLFAELDISMADAGIATWNTKYFYDTWRPVTVIQSGGDGVNPDVTADPTWTSFLTNPNFPEYVSGHSAFSMAAATVLDAFFGDNVTFTTTEPTTTLSLTYTSFDQAAQDAGMSRLYGGIHFLFSIQDGWTVGQEVANWDLATFNISKDTTPPRVTLATVLPNNASNTNVTITGQATDNLSGVAELEVAVDSGAYAPLTIDPAMGNFSFTTSFPLNGSADGSHTINFVATDAAGNVAAPVAFTFTLGTQKPTITLTSPTDGDTLAAGATLTGTVTTSGPALVALSYSFDGGTSMPVAFNTDGSFSQALDLSKLTAGDPTLVVTAQDAAGNTSRQTLDLTLPQAIPLTVTSITPSDGSTDEGVTIRPKVTFSRPIDTTTLNSSNFYATDTTGTKLPATIVPSNDGTFAWLFLTNPMPGASMITITVDGSTITAADGSLLDAAGSGTPGSLQTSTFTTVNQTAVPGTTLSGVLADPGPDLQPGTRDDVRAGADGVLGTADDVYLRPIEGVEVYILGMEDQAVYTNAQGQFSFSSVPTGDVKLAVEGNVPGVMVYDPTQQQLVDPNSEGFYFPVMVMDLTIQPGIANTVMGSMGTQQEEAANATNLGVYLPRIQTSIMQPVSNTQPTMITVPAQAAAELTAQQRQYLTLEVQPNTAIGDDGQVMNNVQVGISTVPTALIKDMLPNGVQQPVITITVQAPGVATFSTPVAVSFPNVYNDPPGSKEVFISFDHTTGRLEIEGTATVSADGQSVVTDPGVGVTHPGWHFVIKGSPGEFTLSDVQHPNDDLATSDGEFLQWDQQINDAVNALVAVAQKIPGLGSLIPTLSVSPIESTLEFIAQVDVSGGILFYGANSAIVHKYYDNFIDGSLAGQVVTASDLVDMAKQDSTVKTDVNNVQQAITNEINQEANTGVVDLDNVLNVVQSSLSLDANVSFVSNGTLHMIIDNTQEADVEVNDLQANGTIIDPSVGGSGTWSADLDYTLSDHFGFDWNDSLGQIPKFLNAVGTAVTNATLAKVEITTAAALADSGNIVQATALALGALGSIVSTFSAIKDAVKAFGVGETSLVMRLLQLHGSAAEYGIEIPLDENISGTFTIPPGYKDVQILPDPPSGDSSVPVSTVPGFGTNPAVYYRFFVQGGLQISGTLQPNQSIQDLVLPPNSYFEAYFYAPINNYSLVTSGYASASGAPTFLGDDRFSDSTEQDQIQLTTFGGTDSDGDGIPDVGEIAIGTDPNKADTNGDGIDDGAELADGLNPLGPDEFPTGVIATLPLPAPGESLAAAGNDIYIADDQGLAVVDGTQFNHPITLGQIALPGKATAVGVDPNLQIAGVATGSTLDLVDVSTAATPKLFHSVSVPAALVVVSNGVAYAASGTKLSEVDMANGAVLQSLTLPGSGSVTGLARDGSKLYAFVSGSDTFSVIDISNDGAAAVLGQLNVSIASFDVGVFAANGIAWLAGSGLHTIDVSNPSKPTLIHGADVTFTAQDIALNGSGLGVLVPNGNSFVAIYDTSDPTKTANQLLSINLPGPARDVAISRGIAYVVDGNELDVVNYLPFDTKGIAPTVSISTSAQDEDSVTPGLQVFEGSTVPIAVNATDDVQVANVELLVDGQVVQNAVSFPFNLSAIAPTITGTASSFTVQVEAIDTGGNVGLSNVLTIGLLSDTSPPTITNFSPANGSSPVEGPQTVMVTFSKPLNPATVTAANFQLEDGSGNPIVATNLELRDNDTLVELTYAPLVAGSYQLIINGPAVTDRVGNALSTGNVTDSFTLTARATLTTTAANVDPSLPGLTIYELTTVPLSVTVAAGVSVKSVAFVVNGQSVATLSSAPYTFTYTAPGLASGVSVLTIQAMVTDTTGFTTTTPALSILLLRDLTPPNIVSTVPANGSVVFQAPQSLTVTFSKPLAESSVTTANFELLSAGPDGVFGDSDDMIIPITGLQFLNNDTQVLLSVATLPVGSYELLIRKNGITDRPGNLLGTGTFASTFSVVVQSQLVVNGGFETGTFSGWTVVTTGSGEFTTYSGTISPLSGYTIPAPDQGGYAAVTDQPGPGSHILYQNIAIPSGSPTATLSFDIFVANRAGVFYSPASLSETVTPNQQARVDIMNPSASPSDVGSGVLKNLFQTEPGSATVTGWTHYTFDVSAFIGSTIRLRFAEVDNQSFFQFGVDDVSSTALLGSSGKDPGSVVAPEGVAATGLTPTGAHGPGSSLVAGPDSPQMDADATEVYAVTPSLQAGPLVQPGASPSPVPWLDDTSVDLLLSSPDLMALLFGSDQDMSVDNLSTLLTALRRRSNAV